MVCLRLRSLQVDPGLPVELVGGVQEETPELIASLCCQCVYAGEGGFCPQVTMFLCCATILAIIHYCNFCQLSFWMRSVLATATGVALLLLLYSPLHG